MGPADRLYVASPGTNSVVVLNLAGKILRRFDGTAGAGGRAFNQPSDVSVSPSGPVYVLDNGNFQVAEMNQLGKSIARWSAPSSSTLYSAHVLPLSNGRLLVSDPTGSLLLYKRPGANAVRLSLRISGTSNSRQSPLGISLTHSGEVLVTDNAGNRLLAISIPTS